MGEPNIIQHKASLAGIVTLSPGGRPLAGARVQITGTSDLFNALLAARAMQYGNAWDRLVDRPDRKRTDAEGRFIFLDLPAGNYTVAVTVPDDTRLFGTVGAQATVPSDAAVGLALALPVTAVSGLVKNALNKSVGLAEVRIKGSSEYTFTDANGAFLLAGVQAGSRTIVASAQGYDPAAQAVPLTRAATLGNVNFTLNLTPTPPQPPPNT